MQTMAWAVATGLLVAVLLAWLIARRWRAALYRQQLENQARLVDPAAASGLAVVAEAVHAARRDFAARRLACLRDVLPPDRLRTLVDTALRLVETERSYLPAHKKGGTVAYETLSREAPELVALYLGRPLRELVRQVTGAAVVPTPIHDQSSLSVLFYERPGDHINWHHDHNFYRGRHFTLLIPLVNHGGDADGLSHARLMARLDGKEQAIATPPNVLILFEGAKVRHKVTPIAEGERRIVLSMTWCTDPAAAWWQGVLRRFKDIGFFGLRALWT